MGADGLPITGLGIDYTKVESIPTKRTLAFLNHFISQTVSFLNKFSCVCEERLESLSVRIQRLETMMSLLETKLSSIPGLENVTLPASTVTPSTASKTTTSASDTSATMTSLNNSSHQSASPNDKDSSMTNVQEEESDLNDEQVEAPPSAAPIDPRYARYFQMLKMGVPLMALRQKVLLDGLDPAVLENPNAATAAAAAPLASPAPAVAAAVSAAVPSKQEGGAKDSESDFSDVSEQSSSEEDSSSGFDD